MLTKADRPPNEANGSPGHDDDADSEDYTSSSGSSSDSSSEDDDGLDLESSSQLPLLLPGSAGRTGTLPASGLSSRLASFLPSIKAANESLRREREQAGQVAHNIEVGEDEDEPHVDMNLGLGVLVQVGESDSDGTSGQESQSESDSEEPDGSCKVGSKRKANVLDVMMGRKKRSKPSIEVVAGAVPTAQSDKNSV